jgi:hypothetical protein
MESGGTIGGAPLNAKKSWRNRAGLLWHMRVSRRHDLPRQDLGSFLGPNLKEAAAQSMVELDRPIMMLIAHSSLATVACSLAV